VLGDDAERLADVLLVQAPDAALVVHAPVIPLDKQVRPLRHGPSLDRRRWQAARGSEPHHERFVLGRSGESGDGRLQDVGRGLPRRG
jgi:hypothetical protein